ncbi:MAG: lipase family protein [Rhodoblastus sp.]|uniref:lipase family protein n=1 Tax=Rhodoblastus sp. TaxID=1962975 RepID=UPI003F943B20
MIDPTDGANPEKRNIVDDALQGSAQVNGSPAAVDLPILRAAYSDRTAALMARLAEFAYDDETAQEGASNAPAAISQYGFRQITWFHNGYTDGWAYIAEGDEMIVLAFRGTQSKQNWDTNFHALLVHPDHTDPALRVHSGFYRAFSLLSKGQKISELGVTENITEGISSYLHRIISTTAQGKPIYITGHSLGGALAQIAAAVYGTDQFAACYTFGSPRVGNTYFDLWVKTPSYRVLNNADIVPQVPLPIIYRHSGDPRYLPATVLNEPFRFSPNIFQRAAQLISGIFKLLTPPHSILGIADHNIGQYVRKLARVAETRTQNRIFDPSA